VPDPLTPGDGQDVLARFKRAREGRDADRMVALFAEEAELRVDPFEPALTGAIDIRRHWNTVAAEQATVEFDAERVWVVGRTVLSAWHEAYTRRASGDRIRVRAFSTMELDDGGLIARMRAWPTERIVARDLPDEAASATGAGARG
jgi:hypothetical protein